MGLPRRPHGVGYPFREHGTPPSVTCSDHDDIQILSHASPVAVIPDHVRETVKTYGKGLLSPWTPQQLILDHPVGAQCFYTWHALSDPSLPQATGWFVTHGGHNGVTEAISAGVPL